MTQVSAYLKERLRPGLRELLKRQGFCACYVIGVDAEGPTKVGYASDMVTRLSQFQSAHWREVSIFSVYWFAGVPLAQRVEGSTLASLKAAGWHLRGEWFNVPAATAAKAIEASAAAMKLEWFTEDQRRAFAESVNARNMAKLAGVFRK